MLSQPGLEAWIIQPTAQSLLQPEISHIPHLTYKAHLYLNLYRKEQCPSAVTSAHDIRPAVQWFSHYRSCRSRKLLRDQYHSTCLHAQARTHSAEISVHHCLQLCNSQGGADRWSLCRRTHSWGRQDTLPTCATWQAEYSRHWHLSGSDRVPTVWKVKATYMKSKVKKTVIIKLSGFHGSCTSNYSSRLGFA